MLRILSDMNDLIRFDVEADDTVFSSGAAETGTWVVKRGDTLTLPAAGDRDAMPIFTESNRDGTPGWSPDASANGTQSLTVLWGKVRAYTDQYDDDPVAIAPGDLLTVDAAGKLVKQAAAGDGTAIAVCTKGPFAYNTVSDNKIYAGKTVIEIFTL